MSHSVLQYCIQTDPLRLCVWVSSLLASTVLILGKRKRIFPLDLKKIYIFLKNDTLELTFLCTSMTCQPEPSKVFKALWWENETTSHYWRILPTRAGIKECSKLTPLIPLNLHQHIPLPYFIPAKYLHHLERKPELHLDGCLVCVRFSPFLVGIVFIFQFVFIQWL